MARRQKRLVCARRAGIFALLAANELNDLKTYLQNIEMERASVFKGARGGPRLEWVIKNSLSK